MKKSSNSKHAILTIIATVIGTIVGHLIWDLVLEDILFPCEYDGCEGCNLNDSPD